MPTAPFVALSSGRPPAPHGQAQRTGAAIDVEALTVRFGPLTAVDGVSFQAAPGEVVALLGPNGAGKTTTLEVLEGYRPATSGRALVLGLSPRADRRALSLRTGLMLQEGGTYRSMGPRQALRLFARYYPEPRSPDELLERLGLGRVASTPYRRLSGGERQRLALGLAIIGRPEVAFLDEPTAGVDPEGRAVVRAIVDELRSEGTCVVVTTHELEEAARMADRLLVLQSGRLVAAGTQAELEVLAGPPRVRWSSRPSVTTGALATSLGAPVDEVEPGLYQVPLEGTAAVVAAIAGWLAAQGLPMSNLQTGPATLEETYLRITQASAGPPGDEVR